MRRPLLATAVVAGTVVAASVAGTGVAAAFDPFNHARHAFVCGYLGDMGSSGLAPECNGWRFPGTFNSWGECESFGRMEVTRPGHVANEFLCDPIGASNFYVLTLNP